MVVEFGLVFITFFAYSVLGWLIETIYMFFETKKVVNRGFLIGPYCPIYGIGCIFFIYFLSRYKNEPIAFFILCSVVCIVLEYITSYAMEKIYKARWWDYSHMKFNVNGRVCLRNSVIFGALGFLVVFILNPFLQSLISKIPYEYLDNIFFVLGGIVFIDAVASFEVMQKVKEMAFDRKKDNTEQISQKVKQLLKENFLVKRIFNAFPNLKSAIKSGNQKLKDKRLEIIIGLKKHIHLTRAASALNKKIYRIKGEDDEE